MKALIPAAGLGTRWYPWSKVIPKELLPLGQYPAIHFILEEAVSAGINDIGIVINKSKQLIRKYIEEIWQLQHPRIRIFWFYQTYPKGVPNALLFARKWVKSDPFAVLYPDEIHPSKGGIVQLCRAYAKSPGYWIGLTASKQNRRQAVLEIEKIDKKIFRVFGFSDEENSKQILFGTGRYILDSGLEYLNDYLYLMNIGESKELDDNMIFEPIWQCGVRGMIFSKPIIDVGTPANWSHAIGRFSNIEFLP